MHCISAWHSYTTLNLFTTLARVIGRKTKSNLTKMKTMRSCSCLKSLPFWLKFNPRLFDWIKDIGVMSTILSLSLSKKNLICAVVVVKWSARSPSTPTIRVRILQFFCTILFEKNENKKRPGLAHFYFLKKKNLIQNRTQNFYHTCWAISISNLLFLSSFFVLVFLSTSDSHFKMVFVDLTPPPFVKGGLPFLFISSQRANGWPP